MEKKRLELDGGLKFEEEDEKRTCKREPLLVLIFFFFNKPIIWRFPPQLYVAKL